MELINRFYKTKTLYKNGIFILICLVLVTIGSFFIPDFKVKNQDKQLFSVNGLYVKHGESEFVSHYFNSIKNNDGVLILGTSESGNYPEGNYFNYLNNDPDLKHVQFSVIGGAGRTCGIHIPTFLKHKEDLKGLKIIYFINPVYWRSGLAPMDPTYWKRDHNYKELIDMELTDKERKKFFAPVQGYIDWLNLGDKMIFYSEQLVHDVHKKYHQDLSFLMNPNNYYDKLDYLAPNEGNLDQFVLFGEIDTEKIDTNWGVSYEYFENKSFDPINLESTYRYDELRAFVALCDELDLDITYLVGPYNKRFVEKHVSSKNYQGVVDNIKSLLEKENAEYIDLSSVSDKAGAFNDLQHHSSYGGFLIYKILKSEYCEI